MADNVTVDNGANPDFDIASDEIASKHYQYVKLASGALDSTEKIEGTAANGLEVDPTRLPALTAGSAIIGKVHLTDGTDDATISVAGARKPLDVHLIDAAGAVISSFGGAGGTSATDDADFSAGATVATPIMGAYQSSVSPVTDTDLGIIGIDASRRVKVSVDASTLDVAHDASDSGTNPVKIGGRAVTSTPTAVASGDRTDAIFNTIGQQQVAMIDPGQQVWKQVEATTTQTGSIVWDPTAGKKIAVTGYEIGTGGTTAALVTLFFDTTVTFTQGTDQVLFRGVLTPTSSGTPGVVSNFSSPVYCTTADMDLRYTTSAGITIYVTVYGFEF